MGILAILGVLLAQLAAPLSGLLVLLWRALSRTPWHEIGYVRPRSWRRTVIVGVAIGIVLKLVAKTIIMPLLDAPAVNPRYHCLVRNPAALPGIVAMVLIDAGFSEETVFRGFLFERLGRAFGGRTGAVAWTVLITSILFAAVHYPEQGIPGVEQALLTGLVLGAMYAATRQIWITMVAHVAFDLTAVAIIYWGLEARLGHLLIR